MVRITVVGSINLDLVARADRLPVPGETLTDGVFSVHPGGKGANQALAAHRLGADVSMIGCVGRDANADQALGILREEGVNLDGVSTEPSVPTGVAVIIVGRDGENQIVVAPGANRRLSPAAVASGDEHAVVCQLEISTEVVERAAGTDAFFVLNAAPVRPVPDTLLHACDLIVVNEVEYDALGSRLDDVPALVALTLGSAGSRLLRRGREIASARPPEVEVIDTVGAGDTFVAALTVALLERRPHEDALRWATVAGSLATTRIGAQTSLPHRADVDGLAALS